MKIKLPRKKQKQVIEDKPQKGFEEFAIDPSILDELDNLPEETEESENKDIEIEIVKENTFINEFVENKEDTIISEVEEIEVIDAEITKQIIDASSNEFIAIVKDNIDFCTKEIKDISDNMKKIENQKNSESFWKKSENIKTISKHVNKMSDIQQKTLDLLIMFLGASGKMAEDYDTILKTIDELGELNGGEAEVLDYLLKVKRMIKEIKNNDERLKSIMFTNEKLQEKISTLEKNYKTKTESYEKNSKIVVSKMHRIHGRLNRQSFSLLISYILIIAISIIIYLKLF